MNIVEIITIGREILDGRVVDTNSVAIAEILRPLGLTPRFGQRVDDSIERIIDAFLIASQRSHLILVTGGLGPTSDDLTAQAFAQFLGEPLVLNQPALDQITAYFKRAGRELLEVQKKQAFVPQSCFILENKQGTAPGFGLDQGQTAWYFMPGVPSEMIRMLREQIAPRLATIPVLARTWATQFVSEGQLQETLTPLEKNLPPGFEVTYRTRFPENHIGLVAVNTTPQAATLFEQSAAEISRLLGDHVFTVAQGNEPLKSLEQVVVERALAANCCVSTVESCTGGLIAHRLTNVAGASKIFWGSSLVYDNSAKEALGVPATLLKTHGAVSREVATCLAEQGLKKVLEHGGVTATGTPLCISTTGITGPAGGTATKPVGLCFIALATPGKATVVQELHGRSVWTRDYQKTFFAQSALELLRRALH